MPDYDLGTARGRIELDASSLGRAQAALKSTGLGLIAVGGAAVAGFAYAVKSAADFEKIISAVGAVTGATGKDLDLLREKALNLATGSIFSADQIARAFEDLGKAGITVPQILDGAAEAVVHLAHAAGDELPGGIAQGAEIIANAMKTFGVGADQAEHFADVLVAAAASSTLSVDDIATSLKYAGPIAHELGLNIDDLSTALAILGDRGIKGSTAGTSLRGVFLGLNATTPKATEAMKKLGLITKDGTNQFFDMHGALKPLPQVMELLKQSLVGVSEKERLTAFNAIFQRRAMNSALILADQGAAGFDKYAQAISKLDASTIAAKKLDNLSGDMTVLKNTVDVLIIRVGQQFQDMLRGWVQGLTKVIGWLMKLDPALLGNIVKIAAIGGAVLIAAGAFLLITAQVIKMYRTFIELKQAITIVSGAMKLLTVSFLTNPVFLFIVAIAAFIAILYLAYKRSDEFRARVDAALNALKPAFQAVVRFVQNFVTQFGNLISVIKRGDDTLSGVAEVIDNMFGNTGKLIPVIKALARWFAALGAAAVTAFDYFAQHILPIIWDFSVAVAKGIGSAIQWLVTTGIPALISFAKAVVDQIGKAVRWLDKNVVPVFESVAELVVASIDRIVRIIRFLWPAFKLAFEQVKTVLGIAYTIISTFVKNILIIWGNFADNILSIIKIAWGFLKNIISAVLQQIHGVIQVITGLISGDWGKVWEGIKNIFGGAWNGIKAILGLALDAIKAAIGLFIDLLISIWEVGWNTLKAGIGIVWELIKAVISQGIEFITGMISNFLSLVSGIWSSIWGAMGGVFSGIWETIKTVLRGALDALIFQFVGFPKLVLGAMANFGQLLWRFAQDTFQRFRDGVEGAINGLVAFVKRIPKMILEALGDLGNILFNAGKKIIGGLIDGIKSAVGGIKSAVTSIPGKIISWKGPPAYDAKFLIPNGQLIMQGLIRGIQSQLPVLKAMMQDVAPTIQANVTGSTKFAAATGVGGLAGAVTTNNASTQIVFDFSSSSFGDGGADEVKGVLTDSEVLGKLTRALKAGVGRKG